ncbi:di-trans,poly-cis-decaprenylcistransferase [Candidatus Woesearchaeota archaeon]|nr:di-trans,poly-cis-decaprenylcistransferase [Candidatus Woesearchaeota archaeon]
MSRGVTHIGIIMDGNRRFAKRNMLQSIKGHEQGAKKVSELLEWCKEARVKELTLYTFSLENFKRAPEEVNYLMDLFRKEFNSLKEDQRLEENKIRIRFLGRTNLLPADVQQMIAELEDRTKEYEEYQINFALAYGGRGEIIDAVKLIAQKVKAGELDPEEIDEQSFAGYLYTDHQPDLVIRTGGDHRTSNFLPYQTAYSEWFFIPQMWPEFSKEDFTAIIEQFNSRERRFGR